VKTVWIHPLRQFEPNHVEMSLEEEG